MVTIKDGPKLLFPRRGKPGAYEGHAFFEASSIRKVDGKYCFVYSSEKNHDLCYAMADSPFGPFTYGGRLVDIGDLGIDGNENEKNARNYLGNTHGGMVFLNGRWYIFYHRQTNQNSYARQACAEKLERNSDGSFRQAELTSCGLNQGPLIGMGRYSARIACNLWSGEGTGRYDGKSPKKRLKHHPYFTQSGTDREKDGDQYIANMQNGAVAGFKYFDMQEADTILIEIRGTALFGEEASQSVIGIQMAFSYLSIMLAPVFFGALAQNIGIFCFVPFLGVMFVMMACMIIYVKCMKS